MEYARWADDLVILISEHPKREWLERAVYRRLEEELAKLEVSVNEEKTKVINLKKGETFIALFTIIRTDRNMLLACYSHKHISYRIRTIIRKAIAS